MQPVSATYTFGPIIGTGNFATLYTGSLRSAPIGAPPVAIKTAFPVAAGCPAAACPLEVLRHEHDALVMCADHAVPYVVALAERGIRCVAASDIQGGSREHGLCVVLELADCNLLSYVTQQPGALPASGVFARFVMFRLLTTLHHLHLHGYAHRDVKPQNILVFSRHIRLSHGDGRCGEETTTEVETKLADFGLAKLVDGMARQNSAGDWSVMAPDVESQTENRRLVLPEQAKKSDVYAAGVTLFFLLTGVTPYVQGDRRQELGDDYPFTSVRNAAAVAQATTQCPAGMDLCRTILRYKHWDRPDAAQALQHPWFHESLPSSIADDSASVIDFYRCFRQHSNADGLHEAQTSSLTERDFDTSSPIEETESS
jgi:serine/threonine protein kinase